MMKLCPEISSFVSPSYVLVEKPALALDFNFKGIFKHVAPELHFVLGISDFTDFATVSLQLRLNYTSCLVFFA